MDYQKLYTTLFNGITETIEELQKLQIEVEEDYLQMSEESHVVRVHKGEKQGDGTLEIRRI